MISYNLTQDAVMMSPSQ